VCVYSGKQQPVREAGDLVRTVHHICVAWAGSQV